MKKLDNAASILFTTIDYTFIHLRVINYPSFNQDTIIFCVNQETHTKLIIYNHTRNQTVSFCFHTFKHLANRVASLFWLWWSYVKKICTYNHHTQKMGFLVSFVINDGYSRSHFLSSHSWWFREQLEIKMKTFVAKHP